MSSKRKFFIIFAAVAMIVAAGAFTAFAQDDADPTLPSFGGMGRGIMLNQRLLWDGDMTPMYAAVADALGIDAETLISELQSGKTLAELAAEAGIDLSALTEATQATIQEHLNAMVAAGTLTQEQAQARLNLMQQNWDDLSFFNNYSYNYGYGTRAGMGRGGMWDDDGTTSRGGMWDDDDTTSRGGRMGGRGG